MADIEVRDVSLIYDTPAGPVHAVDRASFGLKSSEFLCLVGPSGCGKSTLLNILAGFLKPTDGEIKIGGKPVNGHGTDRGIVFQDFAQLFPWRTALGNVDLRPGDEGRRQGRSARRSRSNSLRSSSSTNSPTPIRIICPAACSSASRSRVRSPTTRVCC